MAKIKGKLVHVPVSGGVWRLQGEDGTTYDLDADDESELGDGARVEIRGNVRNDMAGIGMGGGPLLVVRSIRRI